MIQLNRPYRPFIVPDAHYRESVPRDISIRLINAQEEERSRVARELHDDVSQKMALLSLELEQLRQAVECPHDLRRQFQSVQDRVLEISTDIHRLSHKLHPSKLDHLGLAAAVRGLCRDFDAAGKLKVEFHQEGDLSKLPKDVKLCVFRIAQEALRNCSRHSEAGSACVVLVRTGSELRLSVSDDGQGFDMRSGAIRRGLGFTSMRERVRIIGGCIAIRSKPGHGTFIEVSIPSISKSNHN